MKPGLESQTAILVCTARAFAHEHLPPFSDPTALALLPEEARARMKSAKGLDLAFMEVRAKMMVARTVAIDEAIREAANPQLVILGAGLDGRAWRMRELEHVTVFEVDHPDSQRQKRARAAALEQVARDVRFVPVDFTRDSLGDALAGAGHDASKPTTWVWEGVVMYLTLPQIESTLAVIAERSAPGSRLIVMYHTASLMQVIMGFIVRRMGEPLRSKFKPREVQALFARYGFTVKRDDDLGSIGEKISSTVGEAGRKIRHNRIAVADRSA